MNEPTEKDVEWALGLLSENELPASYTNKLTAERHKKLRMDIATALARCLNEIRAAFKNAPSVPTLKEVERKSILDALEKTGWHRGETAKILGISPSTLYRRLRDYGLHVGFLPDAPEFRN